MVPGARLANDKALNHEQYWQNRPHCLALNVFLKEKAIYPSEKKEECVLNGE